MKLFGFTSAALIGAFLIWGASIAPAAAVTNSGAELATPYVAAFAPIFGNGFPRTGTMSLLVRNGTISGTYTGTSIGPDFLDNRIVPVTGTVSGNERYVQLFIGGVVTLRGTMHEDGTISGTADERGRLYGFEAAPHRV